MCIVYQPLIVDHDNYNYDADNDENDSALTQGSLFPLIKQWLAVNAQLLEI